MLSKKGLKPGDKVANKKSGLEGVVAGSPDNPKKLNPCHEEYLSIFVIGSTHGGELRFDRSTEWLLKNVAKPLDQSIK